MELLLESKDGEIAALNEQVVRLGQRNRVLESALGELEERIRGLEAGLGRKEAEILGLEGKLGEREEERAALVAKNKVLCEQIDGLGGAVRELERQKKAAVEKEEASLKEVQRLSLGFEEKCAALSDAVADAAKNRELCRALEQTHERQIRGKEAELEATKKEVEKKNARLVGLDEDVLELREANLAMKSTIERLEDTVAGQNRRLATSEAEASGLEGRISTLQVRLGEKEEELHSLLKNKKALLEQNDLLKQTVHKFEEKRDEWAKEKERFTREVQELSMLLDEKCAALSSATKEASTEKERAKALGSCLTEKVEELKVYKTKCDQLQTSLTCCEEELKQVQEEHERQMKSWQLSAAESRLEAMASRLKTKTEELDALTIEVNSKDEKLAVLSGEAEKLRQENNKLSTTVQRLQKLLDSRLADSTAQLRDVSEKLAHAQESLRCKDGELMVVQEEIEEKQREAERFRQALSEFETRKAEWERKEHTLLGEASVMASSVEERSATLESTSVELGRMKERCQAMEKSLQEDAERLKRYVDDQTALQSALSSSQQEMELLRRGAASEAQDLQQRLLACESQLKYTSGRLSVKAQEMELMSKSLEEKEAHLSCMTDEVRQLREMNLSLTSAAETSRMSNDALEMSLKAKQVELSTLEGKIAAVELKLEEKEKALECSASEKRQLEEQVTGFKQVVADLEFKKNNWVRKEEELTRELQEVVSSLEDKCSTLDCMRLEGNAEKGKREAMQASLKMMENSLKLTVEELDGCKSARDILGVSLASCQEQLKSLRAERDRQAEDLKDRLSATEYQLKECVNQLNSATADMGLIVTELSNKEAELSLLKEELQQLTEKNGCLDFTVQSLQMKITRLSEELKRSEARGQQLLSEVTAAEAKLESSKELISSLQFKVDLGNQISAKMDGANAKIKELESMLAELMAFAQDKDEKLDASEWAVQQLGLVEVSKAKANLERAERERVELKNRCADLENELKEKEEELLDMESCLTHLKSEHDKDVISISSFQDEKCKMEREMERLERELSNAYEDSSITSSKLMEIQSELYRTQLSSKCLVQQMLLLHENLLQDGKALLEIGKDGISPMTSERAMRRNSMTPSSKVFDGTLRNEDVDFDGKENVVAAKNFDSETKKFEARSLERAPFQVLQL